MGDFDKFLDNLKEVDPVADTEPPPMEEVPAAPDPYAHLIGDGGGLAPPSAFDTFLNDLSEEAKTMEFPQEEEQISEHNWASVRETVYEDDTDVWQCKRCFRQINCNRTETLAQCLERHRVNPNCGEQVVGDIHSI